MPATFTQSNEKLAKELANPNWVENMDGGPEGLGIRLQFILLFPK